VAQIGQSEIIMAGTGRTGNADLGAELNFGRNGAVEYFRFAERKFYLPSTKSIPETSNSNFDRGTLPTRSVRRDLSREMIRDTFATESFGSPETRADNVTLPGARRHLRLLVSGTQTTAAMRLWFSASH
jgi:hypothetical protein